MSSTISVKVPGDLMQEAWTELCKKNPLRSSPGHQDPDASLAAPAPVDQVGGTPTLEQFEVFLRNRREKNLALLRAPSPVFERLFEEVERCKPYVSQMKLCELALALVVEFKSEQSA
ncbi:hypothetical protein [Comamonas aquatica]|uniref:hypothetical protein n=1 Tax=Comamonas aquatica TaxID=225991 RepID=UPI00391B5C28